MELHVDYAMVIDCYEGGELYYNLKKFGRYPPDIARYFFVQVVDAIAHMHSRGFCHRDLKPWNIMLTKDLSTVKVIDFSYSTALHPEEFKKCPDLLKGMLSSPFQAVKIHQTYQISFKTHKTSLKNTRCISKMTQPYKTYQPSLK